MSGLTDKQRVVLALIVRYYATTGEPCSMSYLSRQMSKHPSTVRGHVWALAKKGLASPSVAAFKRVLS